MSDINKTLNGIIDILTPCINNVKKVNESMQGLESLLSEEDKNKLNRIKEKISSTDLSNVNAEQLAKELIKNTK